MSYAKPITIIVAGLICAHAANVSAHDLCFRYNNGGGTLVLKSPKIQLNCCPFTAEELNTCPPLNGFESLNGFNLAGAVTGTGCLDAQGNSFLFHYVYHNGVAFPERISPAKSYFETGVCVFGPRFDAKQPWDGHCRGTVLTTPQPPGGAGQFVEDA